MNIILNGCAADTYQALIESHPDQDGIAVIDDALQLTSELSSDRYRNKLRVDGRPSESDTVLDMVVHAYRLTQRVPMPAIRLEVEPGGELAKLRKKYSLTATGAIRTSLYTLYAVLQLEDEGRPVYYGRRQKANRRLEIMEIDVIQNY